MSSTSPIILLDTDIGSDPDDAFALAYLLRQSWPLDGPADSNLPRLAGITSVSGESNLRASLCSAMLYSEATTHENLARESGKNASYHAQAAKELRNLPVVCGRSDPLVEKQRQPKCQQSVVLKDFDHATFDSDASGDSAVSFLAPTILSRPPNTVTLLTIGPMTNIALLFSSHPSMPSRLARLVSMSGIFFTRLEFAINGLSEWNVFLDPHAAQTVCSVSAPAFFVGLDVTTRVTMPRARLEGLFEKALEERPWDRTLLLLARLVEPWVEMGMDKVTFHDPLAAVSLFVDRDKLFPDQKEEKGVEMGKVEVEVQGLAKGLMVLKKPRKETNTETAIHSVARNVDPDVFFGAYFQTVLGKDSEGLWAESKTRL